MHRTTLAMLSAAGVLAGTAFAPPPGAGPAGHEARQVAERNASPSTPAAPQGGFLSQIARHLLGGTGGGGPGTYTSPNTVRPGRNMPAIRAARKRRNVQRHRSACK